jgi:hypothetical protein
MSGLMSFGELEDQFGQISDTTMEEKIPFLQMLQCIEHPFTTTEPNQFLQSLLQIQTLESKSCLTLETNIKRDPGQTDDPEKDPRTENGAVTVKEKRKRKRTRAPKNKDEVENQRMTHIAVERNRRRQMNEHLNSLRSLMPPSFLQRVTKCFKGSLNKNVIFFSFQERNLALTRKRFCFSRVTKLRL